MKIDSFIDSFVTFLKLEGKRSNTNKYADINKDTSIFDYSDEFKNYISDKLGLNVSSINISDLVNMKVENGKLIDPDDNALNCSSDKDSDSGGTVVDVPETLTDDETMSLDSSDTGDDDTGTNADAINTDPADTGSADINSDVADSANTDSTNTDSDITDSASADSDTTADNSGASLLSSMLASLGITNPIQNSLKRVSIASSDSKKFNFADILDKFFSNDKVNKIVDKNKDGTLDEDEITSFLNSIKGLDKDSDSLSMNDLLSAIKIIEESKDGNVDFSKLSDDSVIDALADVADADSASSAGSSGGSSSAGGGNYGDVGDYSSDDTQGKEKTIDNMSLKELKQELDNNAKPALEQKKNALDNVYNSDAINALQKNVDDTYKAFQLELQNQGGQGKQLANQLDAQEKLIDAKQKEIDDNQIAIAKQESNVSTCQTTLDNAISNLNNLQAQKSKLNSSASESADSSDIAAKKKALDEAIAAAETQKRNAETALQNAKDELNTLQTRDETLKGELTALNAKKDEISAEIAKLETTNTALKTAHDAYDKAKSDLEKGKYDALQTAKSELNEAQEYYNKVSAACQNKQNEENEDKYSPTPKYNEELGKLIAQMASKVAKAKDTVGMCLNGVSYALRKFFGQKTALSSLHYAYLAADQLRNDPFLSKHFKEVKVSRSQLSSLPAGAIVVWDKGGVNATAAGKKAGHIAIALGNGYEASDHIQKQMTNRRYANNEERFSVFYPV